MGVGGLSNTPGGEGTNSITISEKNIFVITRVQLGCNGRNARHDQGRVIVDLLSV